MTKQETQQIGKLMGQMDMVMQSLTSLHDKVEAFRDRCGPCKKEILESAKLSALDITKIRTHNIERWVTRIAVFVLFTVCGYLFKIVIGKM